MNDLNNNLKELFLLKKGNMNRIPIILVSKKKKTKRNLVYRSATEKCQPGNSENPGAAADLGKEQRFIRTEEKTLCFSRGS